MGTLSLTTLPANFGSGGANITPGGASAKPNLRTILSELQTAVAAVNTEASGAKGTNLTDADATVLVSQGKWRVLPAATLSAGRTITLGTTGAVAGDQLTVTRLDAGAFTLAFINGGVGAGTLLTLPVSKIGFAKFQFDGTNWALREVGVGS